MKLLCAILLFLAVATAEPLVWRNFEEDALIVDLSDLMDRAKPYISRFMIDNKLDPLGIPDVDRSFWVAPPLLPILQRVVTLKLHSGSLLRLSSLERNGNALFTYKDKVLDIDLGFKFNDISASYNYQLKALNRVFNGDAGAVVKSLGAAVRIQCDLANYKLTLKKLDVLYIESIDVSIRGNGLVEWLVTPATNILIPLFKNTLRKSIEKNVAAEVQNYFDKINMELPHPSTPLPRYNPFFVRQI